MILWMLPALTGCRGDTTDTVDSGSPDSPWEIAADLVPGGVMLSAWTETATDEVLIVGGALDKPSGTLWRYDGTSLCFEEGAADQPLWWIHGRGPGEWIAVGAKGAVLRESAGVRIRDDIPTEATLFGVYDDDSEVWVVAGDIYASTGEVWRQPEGGDWEKVADLPDLMFKVWEDWLVGAGQAYQWDGSKLVDQFPEGARRFMTVRGAGDDLWAVGDGLNQSEVHKWSEGAWSSPELDPRCTGQGLNGVWTDQGEDVWVAGFFGAMARFNGSDWDCPSAPLTSEHFHAAWRWHDETLFVGGNFFAPSGHYGTLGRHGGVGPVQVQPCGTR